MTVPTTDDRTPDRRNLDEQIASEPPLGIPDLSANQTPRPVEAFLVSRRRPVAVPGVVENGVVRPLDPGVILPERSRVIIVAAE